MLAGEDMPIGNQNNVLAEFVEKARHHSEGNVVEKNLDSRDGQRFRTNTHRFVSHKWSGLATAVATERLSTGSCGE